MTDKEHIAKWLKGKLAELCNEIQCEVSELPKDVIEGKILAFKEILSYMKSLQEEPKPLFNVGDTIRNKQWKTATHKIVSMDDKAYYLENEGKVEIAHQELWEVVGEPVSDELEEAAFDYAEACKYEGGEKLLCVEHFEAGAQWQKKKIISYVFKDKK